MSELIKLDVLKADAEAAADKLHAPDRYLEKYNPTLRGIWKTHYYARITENQKTAEIEAAILAREAHQLSVEVTA